MENLDEAHLDASMAKAHQIVVMGRRQPGEKNVKRMSNDVWGAAEGGFRNSADVIDGEINYQ